MPTEKFLNNLIVNKVDNSDTYKAMQTAGLVNEDEIYLIENPIKDWNENNESSAAFVKNRTHYTFYGKTLSYDPMREGYVELNDAEFVNGSCRYTEAAGGWPESLTDGGLTYWFILDGVEYECTSEKFEKVNDEGEAYTEYVLGGADKGYPFRIVQEPMYGFTVYICDEEGLGETTTHSFALYEPGEEIVKLDNKYLDIANEVTRGEARPVSGEAVRSAILDSGVGVVEEYNGDLVTGHTVWEAINNAVVQSDWNENDPEAKAYVKNRPFGYYGKVNSEIFNYNGTFEAEGYQSVTDYTKFTEFWINTEYVVNFDGTEYRYMPVSLPETSDDRPYLGYEDGFNTDWPFSIRCFVDIDYGGEWYIVYAKEAGDHSITLYEVTEGAVKIGEEWLPDTIATKADLEAAIGAAISASY